MPPRSRNVTSNAVSESSPQSPRSRDPTKNKKRDIDELRDQSSPLRRSKRFKSTEALVASPAPGQSDIIDGPSAVNLRQKKPVLSPKTRKSQPRISVKEEVEEEIVREHRTWYCFRLRTGAAASQISSPTICSPLNHVFFAINIKTRDDKWLVDCFQQIPAGQMRK